MDKTQSPLPEIPAKRYFAIGEVSELCGVKAYVLRYWEQEFTQLRPVKRRGNRRYYQHHEVLLIRHIRELLYDQGFTISGARNRLAAGDLPPGLTAPLADPAVPRLAPPVATIAAAVVPTAAVASVAVPSSFVAELRLPVPTTADVVVAVDGSADEWNERLLRMELLSIRQLLEV